MQQELARHRFPLRLGCITLFLLQLMLPLLVCVGVGGGIAFDRCGEPRDAKRFLVRFLRTITPHAQRDCRLRRWPTAL